MDWMATAPFQKTPKVSSFGIERRNAPTAKVTDEQVMAEPTEIIRSQDDGPRRIQPTIGLQGHQEVSSRIENVDETQSSTIDFVMLLGILLGKRHGNVAIDVLNIERCEAGRKARIFEGGCRQCERGKIGVEHIHGSTSKVGYVEVVDITIPGNGDSFCTQPPRGYSLSTRRCGGQQSRSKQKWFRLR